MELNERAVRELLKEIQGFSGASLARIEKVAGDASGRRYYRIHLTGGLADSLIAVSHGETKGPSFSGGVDKTTEEIYLTLSSFLEKAGILTPKVHHYAPAQHLIFVEDIGDLPLYRFAINQVDDQGEKVKDLVGGGDWLTKLFSAAIDVIGRYQAVPFDQNQLAFQRYLSFEHYRREISEFKDFYAARRGLRPSAAEVLDKSFDAICEEMVSFPKTLCHFDCNAYNLFVGPEAQMRVLDFQDASLASPARDIVSLINDRDMDETLGRGRHAQLFAYYQKALNPGPLFRFQYNTTLLHWDFRVTGRFIKLCEKFQTDKYMQWLPGTVRRLGRTLARAYRDIHGLDKVLEIVTEISPEAKEGVEDPWEC